MGKHRKKSKRQKSVMTHGERPDHEETDASLHVALSSSAGQDIHYGHKKRKRQDIVAETHGIDDSQPVQLVAGDAATTKRKKRKKYKKEKGDNLEGCDSEEHDSKDTTEISPLEGSMAGDQMVLLDRSKSIVFSTVERNEDSSRKQIGTIDQEGKIHIHSMGISGKQWFPLK